MYKNTAAKPRPECTLHFHENPANLHRQNQKIRAPIYKKKKKLVLPYFKPLRKQLFRKETYGERKGIM